MKAVLNGKVLAEALLKAKLAAGTDRLGYVFLEFQADVLEVTASDNIMFVCIQVPLTEVPEAPLAITLTLDNAALVAQFVGGKESVTLHMEAKRYLGVATDDPTEKLMVKAGDVDPLNWRPRLLTEVVNQGRVRWVNADYLVAALDARYRGHVAIELPEEADKPIRFSDVVNNSQPGMTVWLMPLSEEPGL